MSKMIRLVDVEAGTAVRLAAIEGGRGVRQRLFSLGFHIGDKVAVQGHGAFRGPVLVNNLTTGTCLAVGRGIAQRIQVEAEDDS